MFDSPLLPLAVFGSALKCGGDMFDMMNGKCGKRSVTPPAPPPAPPPAAPRERYQASGPTGRGSAAPVQSLFPADGKPMDIRPQGIQHGPQTRGQAPGRNPLGPLY